MRSPQDIIPSRMPVPAERMKDCVQPAGIPGGRTEDDGGMRRKEEEEGGGRTRKDEEGGGKNKEMKAEKAEEALGNGGV